jgi:hypothetical protein
MADKDFVTFLVDETLKLQQSGESELSSLELKLKDYELAFFKGAFIPQSRMLRFSTHFGDLDIPVNWSVFSVENSQSDFTLLDQKTDQDCLFEVIKQAWGLPIEKLLITHADGFCYMVGLKSGDETHLHDLLHPQEWLKSA